MARRRIHKDHGQSLVQQVETIRSQRILSLMQMSVLCGVSISSYREFTQTGDMKVPDLMRMIERLGYYMVLLPTGETQEQEQNDFVDPMEDTRERLRDWAANRTMRINNSYRPSVRLGDLSYKLNKKKTFLDD